MKIKTAINWLFLINEIKIFTYEKIKWTLVISNGLNFQQSI